MAMNKPIVNIINEAENNWLGGKTATPATELAILELVKQRATSTLQSAIVYS